jgi:hypothetical protein
MWALALLVSPMILGLRPLPPRSLWGSVAIVCAVASCAASQDGSYPWLVSHDAADGLAQRVPVPDGYVRTEVAPTSFGAWLRALPLKKGRPPVHLYDGRLKGNQEAHWAVVDIDTGDTDLQQCADAVIRLRAEYLFTQASPGTITFDFTSGDHAAFARWADGYRPHVRGNRVAWARDAKPTSGYAAFRDYLTTVFTYAGTASLAKELTAVADTNDVRIGDVFIHGGFPGHAVLVVDVAEQASTGKKVFLLAQGYMPAQEIHLLRNPAREDQPWYDAAIGPTLVTPEWTFTRHELRRF